MNDKVIRIFGADGKLVGLMYDLKVIKVKDESKDSLINAMKELELINPDVVSNFSNYERLDCQSNNLDYNSTKSEIEAVADNYIESIRVNEPEVEEVHEEEPVVEEEAPVIAEGFVPVETNVENVKDDTAGFWNFKFPQKAKKILAGGAAVLVLATGIWHFKNYVHDKTPDVGVTQEYQSLEDLINALKEGHQRETFKTIDDAQKAFNLTAAPTISIAEDNGAQLFLNSEEMVSLFAYANADIYATDTFKEIFGNSGLMDESKITDNYANAGRVLNNYYKLATEPSGLSSIFKDETDKAVFEEFENMVLEYNKSGSNKEEIKAKLTEIYMSGKIDDIKSKNPGVASFIATHMVPSLYTNHVLEKEQYESIIQINETVTCNDLKEELKDAEEACKTSTEDSSLLLQVMDKLDQENIKVDSRELNWEARANLGSEVKTKGSTTKKSSTETTKKVEIGSGEEGRAAAVQEFGEKAVEEAESKAVEEFHKEYDDENAKQEVYGQGLKAGYDISYRTTVMKIFKGESVTVADFESDIKSKLNSYTGKYKDSYEKGLRDGVGKGVTIGIQDGKKNIEIAKTSENTYTETTETTETKDDTPQYPDINLDGVNTVTGTVRR